MASFGQPIGAIGSNSHAEDIKRKRDYGFDPTAHAAVAYNPVNDIGNYLNGSKTENA